MPFELIRDYITLDQEVNSLNTQTSMEEIIKIPDYKPNMRSVLLIDGEVNTLAKEVEGNTINLGGEIDYKIYYIADGGYLDCAVVSLPFDYSLEASNVEGDIEYLVKAALEHVDYRITNSRKVNIRSIMKIEGIIIKKFNFPLLVDVKNMDNIQKLQDKISITKSFVKSKEKITIDGSIAIDEQDESSLKVIDTALKFVDVKSTKSPNGVLITGKVLINTLYSEDTEEKKEYKNSEHSVDFSQFIEKSGVENIHSYFYSPKVRCENIDFSVDRETLEISLNYNLLIETDIRFYENVKIENIQDLYSPEIKSSIEKDVIRTYSLLESYHDTLDIYDEFLLSTEMPVQQILIVNSKAMVNSNKKSGNEISIEGVVKFQCIVSEIDVIEKFEKEIPFTYKMDSGSPESELSDFEVNISKMDTSLKGNTVEINGELSIEGNLFKKIQLNLVKAINRIEVEQEDLGEFYAIVAHYKQPKETLWEIAKNNSTTVAKILEDNNIASEDNVTDYMPLVILK